MPQPMPAMLRDANTRVVRAARRRQGDIRKYWRHGGGWDEELS